MNQMNQNEKMNHVNVTKPILQISLLNKITIKTQWWKTHSVEIMDS